MREIYERLKAGIFRPLDDMSGDVQKLLREVMRRRGKVSELSKEVYELRTSEAYLKVKNIPDWDIYFEEMQKQLKDELKDLETTVQSL